MRTVYLVISIYLLGMSCGVASALSEEHSEIDYSRAKLILLDFPWAKNAVILGINSRGDLVGSYYVNESNFHGFLFADGKFTRIESPVCSTSYAWGINSRREIVGSCGSSGSAFLYTNGKYQSIDVAGSVDTVARGINSRGEIVGTYSLDLEERYGFVDEKGKVISFSEPQATAGGLHGRITQANGINAQGDIIGTYYGEDSRAHGYLLSGGIFTTIDPPGSVSTELNGINSQGEIVGEYAIGSEARPFVFRHGHFTDIATPGTQFSALAINSRGDLAGACFDSGSGATACVLRVHRGAHEDEIKTDEHGEDETR